MGQPQKVIFKKEIIRINKLYKALIVGDTIKYKRILSRITSSGAPRYLIAVQHMIALGETSRKVLANHDDEAYLHYCHLWPLTEKIAPRSNQSAIQALRRAIEKGRIAVIP